MPSLYALNLNFNPDNDDATFESYSNTGPNPTGRAWWQSMDAGGHWVAVGNPDNWTPTLVAGDQVQFAVSATPGASLVVQTALVYVQFARERRGGSNPAKIASPFLLAGRTPRCQLHDQARVFPPWYYIGPYDLEIGTSNPGRGRLKFEFSVVARVSFTNGATKDYGYDPEMDVDI